MFYRLCENLFSVGLYHFFFKTTAKIHWLHYIFMFFFSHCMHKLWLRGSLFTENYSLWPMMHSYWCNTPHSVLDWTGLLNRQKCTTEKGSTQKLICELNFFFFFFVICYWIDSALWIKCAYVHWITSSPLVLHSWVQKKCVLYICIIRWIRYCLCLRLMSYFLAFLTKWMISFHFFKCIN